MTSSSIPIHFDPRQLAHQPLQELHNGGWTAFAEKSSRADIILAELGEAQAVGDYGLDPILHVHHPDYVEFLRTAHADWRAAGREGDAIGYAWPVVRRRPLALQRIDARLGALQLRRRDPDRRGDLGGGLLDRPDRAYRTGRDHRPASRDRLRAVPAARPSFGPRLSAAAIAT